MPRAWVKKVPAIDTLDLFHGHLLPVRENGLKISELDKSGRKDRNQKDFFNKTNGRMELDRREWPQNRPVIMAPN